MVDKITKEQCTGCGACMNGCPVGCISMKADEKGFLYPQIDAEKCIRCGKCDRICPSLQPVKKEQNEKVPEVLAAWSLDEAIRYESTSGGVFSELALEVLRSGGVVSGARYNEQHMVEHCVIEREEELAAIRQSKYIQSDTRYVYRELETYLQAGRDVLFCGTPCECAGLHNYLGKTYENLLCVDFICRGANSPKVFALFLKELEEQYQSKVSRVWFKNKVHGWRKFSTRIEFQNGEAYSKDRYSDTFIRGYIEANLYMRESCEVCQYKQMPRISDITLGDFWGIKSDEVGAETDLGTSLMMLNSEKGRVFVERLKPRLFWVQRSFEEACRGNKCILESPKFNSNCPEFWNDLEKMGIIQNIQRFCKKRE